MVETVEEVRETFRIPDVNFDRVERKLARLARKADKLGTASVTWEKLGEEKVVLVGRVVEGVAAAYDRKQEIPVDAEVEVGWSVLGTRTYVLLKVTGEAPRVEGYRFRGTIVHAGEAGNILKTIIGDDEGQVPERFRTADAWCDHCQLVRNRIDTFLVEEVETGEWKQVGRNCLGDFLGGQSPEQVARYAEYLANLEADLSGESGDWGGHYEETLYVPEYLSIVAASIERDGWVSKGKADEWGKEATAYSAMNAYRLPNSTRSEKLTVSEENVTEADVALTWARDLTDEELGDNDFLWNLHVATAADYTTPRAAGILAAVFIAKKVRDGRLAERVKRQESEYVGEVKKRQVFEGLRYVFGTSFEGYYGVSYLEKFVDADDNVFVWFGKGLDTGIEVGDELDVKATVKAHEEYEGTKQTVLTRLVVEKVHFNAKRHVDELGPRLSREHLDAVHNVSEQFDSDDERWVEAHRWEHENGLVREHEEAV